jgi:hypothetical protein
MKGKTICQVRLDRLQVMCTTRGKARGPKPVDIRGFRVVSDKFVRCQTTIPTYARCRQLINRMSGTRIFWQYQPRAPWLWPWKITFVANDKFGLWKNEIKEVMKSSEDHRLILVEIAFDFDPASGVNREFLRGHAIFGKSRRRRSNPGELRYGTRKSGKLVRVYRKRSLGVFRVELELHSSLLRATRIKSIPELANLEATILSTHFQFVEFDWQRLNSQLKKVFGSRSKTLLKNAFRRSGSIHSVGRFLRRHGVTNVHRLFVPMEKLNLELCNAFHCWAKDFGAAK